MKKRTIALFGGTFDPVHLGHTSVARAAGEKIAAEKVIFIPAKCSPLKGFSPTASDAHRLQMIALATADDDRFAFSDCELKRPAPSYTLDTVRQFQRHYGPDASLHWLLGADGVADFVHWHRIRELIDECNVTTMQRAGCPPPNLDRYESQWGPERIAKLKLHAVSTPLVNISSTEVRRRLQAGLDVGEMLHERVLAYIREHNLYRRMSSQH